MTTSWQIVIVLLFATVVVEAVAILALARSIGLLQIRLGPEPAALETPEGLSLSSPAPAIVGLDAHLHQPITLDVSGGRWGIVFVSATCAECRSLVRDAGRVDGDRAWGARVVIIALGTHEQNEVLARLAPKLMLLSDTNGDMHKAYAVESTPYAFLVEAGEIQAKGIVNHRDHLEALLEKKTTRRPDIMWTRAGGLPSGIGTESVSAVER